jgi:hypothetical protein
MFKYGNLNNKMQLNESIKESKIFIVLYIRQYIKQNQILAWVL